MIGTYDIVIDGPKRHGRGTLVIEGQGSHKTARIDVENFGRFELAIGVDGSRVSFEGVADVPQTGPVECSIAGEVWGNSVDAKGTAGGGEVTVYGTRISSSTGDAQGNDPLWAGRWSDAY